MDLKALVRDIQDHRRVIAEHAYQETGHEGWQAVWCELRDMGAPLDALYKELDTTHKEIRALMGKQNGGDG